MHLEAARVGTRVEVMTADTTPFRGGGPDQHIGAYDNPDDAVQDAIGFLEQALQARRVLEEQREHAGPATG